MVKFMHKSHSVAVAPKRAYLRAEAAVRDTTHFAAVRALGVLAVMALSLALLPVMAWGQEVTRHKTPGSDFLIARAVEVPAGKTTVYVSGAVPSPIEGKDAATLEGWGDTKTQTISVLSGIEATLKDLGLTMGDVVKMQVYLVAPPGAPADFAGFMEGYVQYFGTEAQPNLPARSAMIVAALVNPNWLVEIEVTAVRN